MSDGYEIISLYYDRYYNRMIDQDGFVVDDIFRIVKPYLYNLWKQQAGGYYYVDSKEEPGLKYELVFPFEEEYDDEWPENCYNEMEYKGLASFGSCPGVPDCECEKCSYSVENLKGEL